VSRRSYNVETPHRLLVVAAKIFAERGYRAVTLKDIVAAAGVNGASAHYHFGNKAGLYRAVVRQQLQLREQQLSIGERELRRLRPRQRLHAFISRLMQQLLLDRENLYMARLMLWEAIDPGPAFSVAVKKLPQYQLDLLSNIIHDIVGENFTRRQVRASAISVLGQCVFYRYGRLVLAKIERRAPRSVADVQRIADHICAFSLAALDELVRQSKLRSRSRSACRAAQVRKSVGKYRGQ
jgi:AcrR family transcriptional regulator